MKRVPENNSVTLSLVWIVTVWFLWHQADRGWLPHDEGFLALTAERILLGELPHRDFDAYTGGLAFLHALAFELFGIRLISLRWMLLIFSLFFVSALYFIASRQASPFVAGIVTMTAIAWSLPVYFAALPSWYNLFFATFGTVALLRHAETCKRHWLFLAGVSGGLSCIFKITGFYYVAAALLFLVYREQVMAGGTTCQYSGLGGPLGFRLPVGIALASLVAVVAVLVSQQATAMHYYYYVLPTLFLCSFLLWNEHHPDRSDGPQLDARQRWHRLLRMVLPFAAGLTLPIAALLVPYVQTDSVGDFVRGVVLPVARNELRISPLYPPVAIMAALPLAAILALPLLPKFRGFRIDRWMLLIAVAAAGLVVVLGGHQTVNRVVYHSLRQLLPLMTFIGCLVLAIGKSDRLKEPLRRQQLFLLLVMAALPSLVQFPLANRVYFAYMAPLLILALLYLVMNQRNAPLKLYSVALGLYLVFGVAWLPGTGFTTERVLRTPFDTALAVERGGLQIRKEKADIYRELVEKVQRHSSDGAFIYATPDCPEVYFLAGRRSPTRGLYEAFDQDFRSDPLSYTRRVLLLLEARGIDLVVLKQGLHTAILTRPVPEAFVREVAARYPNRIDVAPFVIFWR